MSSDNYAIIRRHPRGGFAAIAGCASHDYPETDGYPLVGEREPSYPTLLDAVKAALALETEYGLRAIHPECEGKSVEQVAAEKLTAASASLRQLAEGWSGLTPEAKRKAIELASAARRMVGAR